MAAADVMPLVQFWRLADGTRCVVYKEPDSWSVCLERGGARVRQAAATGAAQVLQIVSEWHRELDGLPPSVRP